jgi:hypothetical protein
VKRQRQGKHSFKLLILATKCKLVVRFTLRLRYLRGKSPGTHWIQGVEKVEFIGKLEMYYFLLAFLKD